jgi:hypothetical protein
MNYYENVSPSDPFDSFQFYEVADQSFDNQQLALQPNIGSLTVLNRITGFGFRDTETGFRDKNQNFWLATSCKDVRLSGSKTIGEAIEWVKKNYSYNYNNEQH